MALATTSSVSAAKPMTSRGRFALRRATRRQDVGILDQRERRRLAAVLLELAVARLGDAPVGDRGGEHRDVGRQRRSRPRASMSRARLDLHDRNAGRIRHTRPGPKPESTSAPAAAAARAIAWPCFPDERLAMIAHRIDRLMRRPGGDDNAPAGQRLRDSLRQQALDRRDDLERLGHAADAGLARFRHLAGIGTDHRDAVGRRASQDCAAWRRAPTSRGFIAGAISTRLSVASSTVVARSSARPCAILAMRSAVAGATTTRSVSRARRMWPTSNSLARSNNSVNARSPAIAPTDSGVTNSLRRLGS